MGMVKSIIIKNRVMEFKGTKGKWIVNEEDFFINEYGVEVFSIATECKTNVQMADVFGSKENALLMSKAPEMFEMLIEVLKHHQGGHSEIGFKINKLIKEATEL